MVQYFKSLGLALLLSLVTGCVAKAASFDCNKATTETEMAICSDPELSALDEKLGEQWEKMSPLFPTFDQMQWLAWRDKCENSYCIENAITRRLTFLHKINKEIGQSNHLSCLVGSSNFNIYSDENGLRLLVIDGPNTFKKIQMTSEHHGSGVCRYFDYSGLDGNTKIFIREEGRCSSGEYPFQEDLVASVMIGSLHFDCLSVGN
jgi:uncharacterized protein